MGEFESMVARHRKWTLYLLALYVLGAVFLPYSTIFNGLILGGAISFYNLWLLQRKSKAVGEQAATGGSFRGGLGTFLRMIAAALGALFAMRQPETFHIIAVVIGIMSSYFIIVLDGVVRVIAGRGNFE
jgi:ATP synthase protein I